MSFLGLDGSRLKKVGKGIARIAATKIVCGQEVDPESANIYNPGQACELSLKIVYKSEKGLK